MLPPSDSDSDASSTDDVDTVCNPNRPERLPEADRSENSDSSDDLEQIK